MQDDQRNGEDQLPDESGSATDGADAGHRPGLSDAEPAQPSSLQSGDPQPTDPSGPASGPRAPYFAPPGYGPPGYGQLSHGQASAGEQRSGEPGYGQTAPLGQPGEYGGYGPGDHGPSG
ncbi:MAG: hypothetical protein ACTHJW_15260, partial [Streptosporangiaceae bacterium]